MTFLTDAELYAAPEPTPAEWQARCLLAQALVAHRLDTTDPDVLTVLRVLRGDLSLDGGE